MNQPKIGFRTQVLIIFSAFLLLVNIALGVLMMRHARSALRMMIQNHMLDTVNIAASMIDGDMYEKISPTNAGSPEYRHVFNVLSTFESKFTLKYIYGMRKTENGKVIFTIDPAMTNATAFGEEAIITPALTKALTGVPSVCEEPYTDDYGKFYTAYSPVRNSYGNVVGIVAADCDATWYDEQMWRISVTILFSCIISLLIGVAIVFVFADRFRRRFQQLNSEMYQLADDVNLFTQKITGVSADTGTDGKDPKDTKSLLQLEEQSSDEIRKLGDQIKQMRHDLQAHIDKVYSLAFRDPLTGVKSKQAYVEYEQMTDRMIAERSIYEFAVAVFDVNNLKQVNDTLGHKAGDELIQSASAIICEKYAHSPVFRIGGDEFVVVLKNRDFANRHRIFAEFRQKMEENSRQKLVVVSAGMSDYMENKDLTLQDVFQRADSLMYQDKKQWKGVL